MPPSDPSVIIIAGPNGAGKSTLAPELLRDRFAILDYVNADAIAGGLSGFAPERQAFRAGRIMLSRLRELGKSRVSFGFETTLSTRSYLPWLRNLVAADYTVHIVFLWLRSPALAEARVLERVRLGGHRVAGEVIHRRYARGISNFKLLYCPLATHWQVFDNSGLQSPTLVARGRHEQVLEIRRPTLWRSFLGTNSA